MTLFSPKFYRLFRTITLLLLAVFLIGCTGSSPEKRATSGGEARPDAININSAGENELQRIPGIGPKTAAKIVAYRRDFGSFKTPAELILVDGFGEKEYLKIRHLIRIE